MIIPKNYYKEKVIVKLSKAEIQIIIDELGRVENNLFVFFEYDKIIDKLKKAIEIKK